MNSSFDHSQMMRQDQYSLKRRWQQQLMVNNGATPPSSGGLSFTGITTTANPNHNSNKINCYLQGSTGFPAAGQLLGHRHDDLVSAAVVPAVTVVLEGRSICHRISLHKHSSYQSLAKAIRQMFGDGGGGGGGCGGENDDKDLDLSNAVPGHLIAYEDMENDLLLAGDLNWKDFVRVAKRIRILPAKSNSTKRREEKRSSSRD
ncbi:auxin-responsive protein IAA33 [Humulus lupulus]|uniref:auxin-responsive protein IAA33 n=1 Tax=Humulus lupulus TaxID=3486 RepID=UPI002B4066D3|nr:auxin-responsive protein IAA33 [Humulus lupulus]